MFPFYFVCAWVCVSVCVFEKQLKNTFRIASTARRTAAAIVAGKDCIVLNFRLFSASSFSSYVFGDVNVLATWLILSLPFDNEALKISLQKYIHARTHAQHPIRFLRFYTSHAMSCPLHHSVWHFCASVKTFLCDECEENAENRRWNEMMEARKNFRRLK